MVPWSWRDSWDPRSSKPSALPAAALGHLPLRHHPVLHLVIEVSIQEACTLQSAQKTRESPILSPSQEVTLNA